MQEWVTAIGYLLIALWGLWVTFVLCNHTQRINETHDVVQGYLDDRPKK